VSNVDTALNVDSCYFDSLRPDGFADDIGFRVYSADLHAGPFVEEEVGRLYESSPAAKAGIKEGDVIVAADGQRFDALYSLAALARSELLFASGSVVLRVRRASGSEEELTVVPETNPIDPSSLYLGVPAYCAKVVDLVKSSSAAKAGLEPGDLILGIDGKRFDAAHDLATLLVGKNPGDTVTLLVRKGTDPERMIVIKLGVNPTTKKAFLGIQYQRIPL
jgi:S1-C subfamily serine protease